MDMALILALALAADAPPAATPVDFALPAPRLGGRIVEDCRAQAGEILVCGRRGQSERAVEPVPPKGMKVDDDRVDLGFDTAIGRVDPVVETAYRPDGFKDNRAMVRLKIGF